MNNFSTDVSTNRSPSLSKTFGLFAMGKWREEDEKPKSFALIQSLRIGVNRVCTAKKWIQYPNDPRKKNYHYHSLSLSLHLSRISFGFRVRSDAFLSLSKTPNLNFGSKVDVAIVHRIAYMLTHEWDARRKKMKRNYVIFVGSKWKRRKKNIIKNECVC